jgi:hypothetical protein
VKARDWIIVALFAIIVATVGLSVWAKSQEPSGPVPATAAVRDSIRIQRETVQVHTVEYVTRIKRIPADTLGPILRALAARPLVQGPDTIQPEPEDTTCRIMLTCEEGRRLAIRDTLKQVAQDFTNGDLRIQEVRADSLAVRLDQCLNRKPSWSYVAAFEAGYLAGTVVTATICVVAR